MNDYSELALAFRQGLISVSEFRAMVDTMTALITSVSGLVYTSRTVDCGDFVLRVEPAWGI